jgi:hypothetical protein
MSQTIRTEEVHFQNINVLEFLAQIRTVHREEYERSQFMADDKLLSPAVAAKLFEPAISTQTLTNWVKEGLIPQRSLGGKVLYLKSDILEASKKLKKYEPTTKKLRAV